MYTSYMFDLISIGDSTIDVFLELHEATVNCELVPHECKLVLTYGDKIPVDKMTRVAAVGNAANNAIGSARLRLAVGLYTMIGDDSDGREMRAIFKQENVHDDYVITDTGKRSNFSTVITFQGERTILVYHEPREYHMPQMEPTQWVYLTSIGKEHHVLHEQVLAYIHRVGAKLMFQPGSHQLREGLASLKPMLAASAGLILNKEEAQGLLQRTDEIKDLLPRLYEMGPKTVVITDGQQGSWSYDGQTIRFAEIIPEKKFVERTGAGDAYSTGFLAAVISGQDIATAMLWGSANSSSVVEYVGAREGLLTPQGIQERIGQAKPVQVVGK